MDTATFGGGCFWCTEAVFQDLKGVNSVISGYMGGFTHEPTYEQICGGNTGHAEVIQIQYDPSVISYNDLLLIFFKTHDPTTLNRQGNDRGTQYRSVVFYHNKEQELAAQDMIERLEEEKIYELPIVTEVAPVATFYPAEAYHQNYYKQNPYQGYCSFVIQPKLAKFTKEFKEKLRS